MKDRLILSCSKSYRPASPQNVVQQCLAAICIKGWVSGSASHRVCQVVDQKISFGAFFIQVGWAGQNFDGVLDIFQPADMAENTVYPHGGARDQFHLQPGKSARRSATGDLLPGKHSL